jgi:glycosyltransferase involved in cell wall biosynthesis
LEDLVIRTDNSVQGPSISIAVPVYNQASTIQETIESALKATKGLPGTEIVVSESDSNDGTEDMVSGYCDRVVIMSLPFILAWRRT